MEGIRKEKQEDQESEAIRKFYDTRPGWSLLQVAKCPTLGCGKPLTAKYTSTRTENGGLTLA